MKNSQVKERLQKALEQRQFLQDYSFRDAGRARPEDRNERAIQNRQSEGFEGFTTQGEVDSTCRWMQYLTVNTQANAQVDSQRERDSY